MKSKDFFSMVNQINNVYRAGMGLEPLPNPDEEKCDCGKPATYLGMCNGCYHSALQSSKEEEAREPVRGEE